MEEYRITLAKSHEDLERCYSIIKELRKDLSFSDYLSVYENAHKADGYEMATLEGEGQVFAAMGFRILHDFVHGKHLYIDDLVVTEGQRSKGHGATLLRYAEKLGENLGCKILRLCTGIENEMGKKFYERNDWNLRAVVFKKKLK